MKKIMKVCSLVFSIWLTVGCSIVPDSSQAFLSSVPQSESSPSALSSEVVSMPDIISSLKAAENTSQIITVVLQSGSLATITLYEKSDSGWSQTLSTDGFIGYAGMTENKTEGDGCTPVGCYTFGTAFGIPEDPGTSLSYRQLTEDDYWVDDSDSQYYNQMVNTGKVEKDWESAEHLITETKAYQYAAFIKYNADGEPGKGSAIFLHCLAGSSTAGCVSVPEEIMVELLQKIGDTSRIIIVKSIDDLSKY